VAVLSRPLERRRAVGWVICHSFAQEHYRLYRTDVAVARALASTGFLVLRYHGQGYGDSEGRMEDITLSSHLADARDAVRTMREQGLEAVGVIGTRFGGTIAAMVADELGAHALAVVDPVMSGREFMRV